MNRSIGIKAVAATLMASAFRPVHAQQFAAPSTETCSTIETRTAPPSLAGAYIRNVGVRTEAPIVLPIGGSWLSSLRRRTETSVIQRQLLFAPGERLDSARLAETLRRLRDQRLYSDIVLEVSRCTAGDTVDLTLTTRDSWTLHPIARIVPPNAVSLGIEDRNVLGTGRSFSISNDQTLRGHGGSVSATDPWMFGSDVVGAFRFVDIAGAHLLRASARNHERSLFDPWRVEAAFGRQTFGESAAMEHPLGTFYLVGYVGHLIGASTHSATLVYAGVERDQGRVMSIQRGDAGVPKDHQRDFESVDLAIQRRTAQFDTVSWLASGRGFLDIPTGAQGDLLIGAGKDRSQDAGALRYDAWAGRMWIPSRGRLLTLDAWTSGFVGSVRPNHIDRLSASAFLQAPDGFWAGRMLFEQLIQLDPDLRMLSLANIGTDPSYAAVPTGMRLADRVLASTVERSVHIRPVGRASMLDGSVFAAGSLRWDAPPNRTNRFGVGVVGARLRFFSANGSFGSTRVDLGFPVASNGSVSHRPLLSVSATSLFDVPRQRDGRRRQQ